jgi:hypothetical protein
VFWSLGSGWGSYAQRLGDEGAEITLSVAYGELSLRELYLGSVKQVRSAEVTVDGRTVAATFAADGEGWTVLFGEPLLLTVGQELCVIVS